MLKQVLEQYGQLGVAALKEDISSVSATGKTAQSIRYEVITKEEIFRLVIYGRAYFSTIETGRGPRKSDIYQGFDKYMLEYMAAKGIGSDLSQKKKEQLAKFLAYKINKEGDATFKKGGRVVYSPTITKLAQEIITAVKRDFIQSTITRIRNVSNRTSTATGDSTG